MKSDREDRDAIRDLVRNWVVWRDAGDRERFRTAWHPKGWMPATWFQGPASGFKGYRHRAYIQEKTGYGVKRRGSDWLGGAAVSLRHFLGSAVG